MARELDESRWSPIDEAILAGRKIEAIKLHREVTDSGLAESKDAVERRESLLRQKFPDRIKPQGKGCMTAIVLILVPIALAAARFIH